jgi:2'-5' RNA ligase
MGGQLNEAQQIYERLWREAVSAFERNELEFDRHLPDKSHDLRRGLSLALRPCRAVQNSINRFLHQLAEAAPGQYFYRPEELHVTVLSIIPGSESWRSRIHHLPAYQAVIEEVLRRHRKFSITFQGVTASRGGVMIQGFPGDGTLSKIREDLREALREKQLGGQLDARYKINTAHITVMRFCDPKLDGKNLLVWLGAYRATGFGEMHVENLELIFGDWYASADTANVIQEYRLTD